MSKKIKCLIVDDEPIGREIVEGYVMQTANLELVASCQDAFEALDILQYRPIDLLISDIQMPKVNGLDLVKSLPTPPAIIFITAHSNFAVDSFDLNITDYLLKPVAYERFLKAANKAVVQVGNSQRSSLNDIKPNDFIFLKADNRLNKILIHDIVYIEALKDYIKIVCNNEQKLIVHSSMKAMEEKLPSDEFFRIHKSCIIALKQIKSIEGNNVEFYNGESQIIAKARKEDLYKALDIGDGL